MTDYILDTVHRLQKKLHTRDPFEAAKLLGIHVLYRNLNNLKGFYTLRCRERYIVINEGLSQGERTIVCAHELGHDRLHRHFAQYTPLQDLMIYDMTLKPEREANIFATEFLLSDSDILENADKTVEQLSSLFGVDERYIDLKRQLMQRRLQGTAALI